MFRQWLSPGRAKSLGRILRAFLLAALLLTAVAIFVVFIHQGLFPVLAWLFPSLEGPFFELGVYGAYPRRDYVSFDLRSPRGNRVKWHESCDGGLIFTGPNGASVVRPGPFIMDTNGQLVWTTGGWGAVMNFNVQKYKGENYLTFWFGHKSGSNGQGEYVMLDSSYKEAYRINAVGEGNTGDLHEFRLTQDGTALISIFNNTQADLRRMEGGYRPHDGWLTDGMFQEVNIETNELLFEWRAIDHFKPEDTYYFDPFGGYYESHPFDYYHLNSIEKDSNGNFLISSRHYHHILTIDGKTGEVLWTFGGRFSDFTDLSDGHASDFQWQHNPRWQSEEEGLLSFFDNGVAGPLHVDAPYSKGKLVKLDVANKTVELVQDYVSLSRVRSASQGNVYMVPEKNHALVGWGATGAYSEFEMDGTLLCEVHYGASWFFWWERIKTYRVYRVWDWVGTPGYPPTARIKGKKLYVSWNGATEVRSWELQGSNRNSNRSETFETIEVAEKQTFEHAFALPSKVKYKQYRVAALDGDKKVLSYSDPAERVPEGGTVLKIVLGMFAGGVTGWLIAFLIIWNKRRRQTGGKGFFGWATWRSGDGYQYSKL